MGTVRVHAPVKDYDGVVAGVQFEKGEAEVERGSAAYRYFRSSGYRVEGQQAADPTPEPPDPRELGTEGDGVVIVGTKLRDAAVDPRPTDFLPPTNAGQENPHGPLVVSPGLHAAETGPIAPGAVSNTPAEQEAKETDLAAAVFVEQQKVPEATADVPNDVPHGTVDAADPQDPAREGEDQQDRDDEPADSYSGLGLEQLRAELKDRGLPTSGNKPALAERLRAHDRETGRPEDAQPETDEQP